MKKQTKLTKTRFILLCLFSFMMSFGGVRQAWAYDVLSEGFENGLNGWTMIDCASGTGIVSNSKTGSKGFTFSYNSNPPQYLISPELSVPENGSNMQLSLYYAERSSSYHESFQIGYSTTTSEKTAFTWDTEITTSTTSWVEYTNTSFNIPVGVKYIAIKYNSNNQYNLYIDDIRLTCAITGPALAVADGSTAITSGYNYSFGLKAAGTTKTFTLSNPGTEVAPISVSHTGSFGVTVSDNATSIPAGESVTLTVTMPITIGENSDVITISSTSNAIEDFVINVSGTVRDPQKMFADFAGGTIPDGWTAKGVYYNYTNYEWVASEGYISYRMNSTSYMGTLTSPLLTLNEGETIFFETAKYGSSTYSTPSISIEYSIDGNTWANIQTYTDDTYGTWTQRSVTIPVSNAKYIRFEGCYIHLTNIYGGKESTAPIISLSPSSYDFGLISTSTTSSDITITNTGKSALADMVISSNNANFTVNNSATTVDANGGTSTFTVTMVPNVTGAQNATITISSSNANDVTLNVTGAVMKDGTTTVDFNSTEMPSRWTNASDNSGTWTLNGETAYADGTRKMVSPKLAFVSGDFLLIKAKQRYSGDSYYVKVEGAADNTTAAWSEPLYTKTINTTSDGLNTSDFKSVVLSGIPTTVKYLRITAYYAYLDEIAGLTYAPVLSVTTGDPATAVSTPANYAFGEQSADASVTYNFANAGAGTINITNVTVANNPDDGTYTTNWTSSVAAPFDLIITQNYDADKAGAKTGVVTVTTTEGEFAINLTGTTLAADAPASGLYIGDAIDASASGAAFDYGIITENATKSFKIKNDGTGTLQVTGIALPEGYSIDITAPTTEAPLSLTAGQSQTVNLTLAAAAKAIRNDNITISFAGGLENFTFAAKAYILTGTETVDFATEIPGTWDNESNGWSVLDGAAKCTGKKNLTTSKLTFGENDFFIFKVKASDSGSGDYVTVEGSTDNGSTWTAFDKKTYSYSGDFGANTGDYSTIVVEVPSTVNKLRFNGYYVLIDEIAGLTYDANDPHLAVYSDAEATQAVTTATTKDFGWVADNADDAAFTATYYIKNGGTGTLTISNISEVEGFTAATAGNAMTVSGDNTLALTIIMDKTTIGEKSGTFTLTTDGGNFTIPVKGFVYDHSKNLVDFTTTTSFPAGWNAGSWTISNNMASSSSSSTMETKNFTVAANEKLYVDIKGSSSYGSKTFSYSYSADNGTNWSDAVTLINASGYTTVADQLLTISDIADATEERTVLIRFTGTGLIGVRRIYGFTAVIEPIMTTTAADIAFGMQTAESDEQTFTISNEGTATLEGLSVTLGKTGDNAEYSVALYDGENVFSGTELAVGKTITAKLKQLYDINNLGAKSDVLTIAATGQTPVAINLTGATRDASKLFVDFEDGNIPTAWINASTNSWTINTQSGNKYLRQYRTSTSKTTTQVLTVADNEALTFDLKSEYSDATLTVRYSTNAGLSWTDYATYTYNNGVTSNFETKTISGIPAGDVILQFDGMDVGIDNVSGFAPKANAPIINVANVEGKTVDYDFGDVAEAAGKTKTYQITNIGQGTLNVSAVATSGVATVEVDDDALTNGETATVTITMPRGTSDFGVKNGVVTISFIGTTTENFVVNYTATTIDPTAVNVDFAGNTTPDGWYNAGWSFTGGYAYNYNTSNAEFITQKLTVSGITDALTYKVAKYASYSSGSSMTVEYSTDRKNWTAASVQPSDLTTDFKSFTLSGLEAGDYYVRFAGAQVKLDEIKGWHMTTGIEHDLYVSASIIPTATKVPGTEITATATVYNLRAENETGVYAKLFFDDSEVVATETQDITLKGSANFTLTGNVPADEDTYSAKIVVYYSNGDVAFETLTTNVKVEHTRTLAITDFVRVGEGTMDANSSNQISPEFKVTVQNTGSTPYASPTVKVFLGDTEVGEAMTDAIVATGESTEVTVIATNMSAGEGGDLSFTAKAYWGTAEFSYATPVVIAVNAAAPQFALAVKGGDAVANNANVAFGLVKAATTKIYTITNSGTANLELKSIVAPTGYTTTALTNENKVIAPNGTLDIDVTLAAEQGKKSGELVFTYKVDATNEGTFTLNLSGRSVNADTWTEDFASGIPNGWMNTGWQMASEMGDHAGSVYSYAYTNSLMTPRLAAVANEELTFEVKGASTTYPLIVEYSTNREDWTQYGDAIVTEGEQTFVAPTDGNYYLRFSGRYDYLDNFVGFRVNHPDYALAETSTFSGAGSETGWGNVTVTRTYAAGWNTLALPFALTADMIAAHFPATARFYTLTGYNATTKELTFTNVTSLAAGEPAIVYMPEAITNASANYTVDFGLTNVTVTSATMGNADHTYNGVSMKANFSDELSMDGKHGVTAAGKLAPGSSTATLKSLRAYFTGVPQGAGVRIVVIDEATGISRVVGRELSIEGQSYNLQGQRVESLKKGGLYIKNGRKIVMK